MQFQIFYTNLRDKYFKNKEFFFPYLLTSYYSSIINNDYKNNNYIFKIVNTDINHNISVKKLYNKIPNIQYCINKKKIVFTENYIVKNNKQIFDNLTGILQQIWITLNILEKNKIYIKSLTMKNIKFINLLHDIILLYDDNNTFYEIKTSVFVYLTDLEFINVKKNIFGEFLTSFLNFCDPCYDNIDINKLSREQAFELINKYGGAIHKPHNGGKRMTELYIDYCKILNIPIDYDNLIYLNMIYKKIMEMDKKLKYSWEEINNIDYYDTLNICQMDEITAKLNNYNTIFDFPVSNYLLSTSLIKCQVDDNKYFNLLKHKNSTEIYEKYETIGNYKFNIKNEISELHKILWNQEIYINELFYNNSNNNDEYVLINIDDKGIQELVSIKKINITNYNFDNNYFYYIYSDEYELNEKMNQNIFIFQKKNIIIPKINYESYEHETMDENREKISKLINTLLSIKNNKIICHNIIS